MEDVLIGFWSQISVFARISKTAKRASCRRPMGHRLARGVGDPNILGDEDLVVIGTAGDVCFIIR